MIYACTRKKCPLLLGGGERTPVRRCTAKNCQERTFTNYDRIISKTPEELAEILAWPYVASPPWCDDKIVCPYMDEDVPACDSCALEWLKQEAVE